MGRGKVTVKEAEIAVIKARVQADIARRAKIHEIMKHDHRVMKITVEFKSGKVETFPPEFPGDTK